MIAEILALIKPWNLGRDAGLSSDRPKPVAAQGENASFALVSEAHFRKVLSIEQKRAERSERRFVLMHVHIGERRQMPEGEVVRGIAEALSVSTRETDLTGWYSEGSVVGVLCTEIGKGDLKSILSALHSKVSAAIRGKLEPEQTKGITVSFQVFPAESAIKKNVLSADVSPSPDSEPVWSNTLPDYSVAEPSTV